MRSNVALLAPVLALILSACAPLPPSPDDPAVLAAAEEARAQEAARTEAQLAVKKQIDLVARHTRAICVAPENRAYFRHTPCLPVEVTEKHLADKKLPTAAELRIAKRVFSRIDDMNRETLAVMQQTGDPHYKDRGCRRTGRRGALTEPISAERSTPSAGYSVQFDFSSREWRNW